MSDVKRALERSSERFDLEPGAIDRFFRRRERRERRQRVAAICLALGLAATGALIAVRSITGADDPRPAAPKTDQMLLAELAGTYSVSLTDAMPFVTENDLAGEYTMTLRSDGVMELSAPSGFVEGRNPSGISFRISGDELTTNAFVNVTCNNTVGRYRWSLSGDELSLEAINEPCALRRALFSSETWTRT